MIIDPTHITFTASADIDGLIQPLKDFFDLSSFVYQKNFNDGTEIRLSNQPKWVHYFYAQELYKQSLFERPPSEFAKARIVWAGLAVHQPILDKAREFDIDHGITFIEPCPDGCEFFFLGTTRQRQDVMSKYLANLDLIERFLVFFREKAAPLIARAQQQKIIVPHKFSEAPQLIGLKNFDRAAFLKAITPDQFSVRELDCMRLLARGYTQKMMAKELGISPRTVESHLERIKQKTDTYSKSELVKYLLKMPTL